MPHKPVTTTHLSTATNPHGVKIWTAFYLSIPLCPERPDRAAAEQALRRAGVSGPVALWDGDKGEFDAVPAVI